MPSHASKPSVLVLSALLSALAVSGCVAPSSRQSAPGALPGLEEPGPAEPKDVSTWTRCEHPWPCGDGSEWPAGAKGPYNVLGRDDDHKMFVTMEDGTVLAGWVFRPDVPAGVRVPIVLHSSNILTSLLPSPDFWPDIFDAPGVSIIAEDLVRAGYAVAAFAMRGTGLSTGCFDFFDPRQATDQATLIESLASQSWSNGRVGMIGLSYDGALALMAATENPPALKTIIPVATAPTGMYEILHTPQGAKDRAAVPAWLSDAPPVVGPDSLDEAAATFPGHICKDESRWRTIGLESWLGDDRDATYYEPHDLTRHLGNVTAATFQTIGTFDGGPVGGMWARALQEDVKLQSVGGPKRLSTGPWHHTDPAGGFPNLPARDGALVSAWHADVIEWYDFWLKGIGDPPKVGVYEYTPDRSDVRKSAAWPPAEAAEEVLYLVDGDLAPRPATGTASYVSAPLEGTSNPGAVSIATGVYDADRQGRGPGVLACSPIADPRGIVFRSAPLTSDALLAGNPFAYLALQSDSPGGVVTVYVFRLGPDDPCDPVLLTAGAANLRLHRGGFEPVDFPVGRVEHVRIDLDGIVTGVPKGDSIVVVVSAGDASEFVFHKDSRGVSVTGDATEQSSAIVLPFVEGTLGGKAPSIEYPLRPFTSAWYEAQAAGPA